MICECGAVIPVRRVHDQNVRCPSCLQVWNVVVRKVMHEHHCPTCSLHRTCTGQECEGKKMLVCEECKEQPSEQPVGLPREKT